MSEEIKCHCGKPLHYNSQAVKWWVEKNIEEHGRYIKITVENRTFKVCRHYIALHGVKGGKLATLGFDEVK